MEQVARIFDYMKRAFVLNKENRGLYKPQIALIILKTCLYILFGLLMYRIMVFVGKPGFNYEMLKDTMLKSLGWWVVMIVLYALASIIVEAGLFNMYKSCVLYGNMEAGTFLEGVGKYFFRFLLADVLMILAWGLFLIPYILIGMMTLMAGFVLIPLVVAVFTAMWKVTMVMEETKVIESLKGSFRFAKGHFWPLTTLVILQRAFSSLGGSGGSSNSNAGSWQSGVDQSNLPAGVENVNITFQQWYSEFLPYIKTGFYIILPVVSIAVIISSLIKMVFKIFFSLTIFVMYSENEGEQVSVLSKEVF